MKQTFILILLAAFSLSASDQIPAARQTQPILIQQGMLHTVSHGDMVADILLEGGLITRLEERIEATDNMLVYNARGKHVYPGMIAAVSALGLVEISAVRATRDFDEVGEFTPEVRANVSYNPDSEAIPVTRSNGVLFVNVTPSGGLVPGQSSLMALDGWTWEDATLQHPTAMQLNWPNMNLNLGPKGKRSVPEQEQAIKQQLRDLDELLDKTRSYAKLKAAKNSSGDRFQAHDLRLEAMLPFVLGEKPFFVHARDVRQIEAAVLWADRQQVKIAIVGGNDAWMLTDLLQAHAVPVVIDGTLRLPTRRYSNYEEAYSLAATLHAGGVKFCISTSGSGFDAATVRDLPNHAAMAAAFGLPLDEALRSITLSPAEILGVSDRIGSLDTGKDATLFIASGDILEITSLVEQAFIHGTITDMNDKHKSLYHKYEEKYRRLGEVKP